MIHNRDLVFPLARRYSIKRPVLKMPIWAEEKLDGWRLMMCKGRAYGRNLNDLGYRENLWDKLPDHLQELAVDDFVDGELIWPGRDSSDVATGLAERREELAFIGFRVYDKPYLPHEHLKAVKELGFEVPTHLEVYTHRDDFDYDVMLALAEEMGYEGWIIKERYPLSVWWKLKLVHTYDLLVTGLEKSTAGRNFANGWVKSLRCSAIIDGVLTPIANVSGMNDETRSSITVKDVGRVVEVVSNLRASCGRLRHPRFIKWRDDKDESQIFKTGS